ncbi:MAG: Ig-like domain-containing protein, partial [Bacteroidales bacterium]|nr:Ig-like domain-containing protein [Bacteroidales bacterium]
ANYDFTISEGNPLLTAGSDGGPVGDPRWVQKATTKEVTIKAILTKVVEGLDIQLEAVVTLEGSVDKTVTWSVENNYEGTSGTATIDASSGLLSPTAAGKVKVTATSNYNSAYYDTIIVTIETKTLVTSITLSATNAQGNPATEITNKGGFLNIAVTIEPGNADDRSITWSLSGDGQATIVELTPTTAKLTAVKCGDVVVRATANDGSDVYGELTIPISGQVLVTEVTVAGEGGATEITVNAGTLQMIATVLPDSACEKEVTWSVDNESVATISETGLLTAVGNGTVVVTARATDGTYKSGTATITVSNQGELVTDTEAGAIQMVPNPATDFIMIKSQQRSEVTISNITGAVVLITEVDPNIAVPVAHLKAGLYIVNVKSGNQDRMFRLVKE